MKNKNFLKTYQISIMPKIKELDTIMHSSEYYIDISELSKAISADTEEIQEILSSLSETQPTKENIFDIIASCKSDICQLIMRESLCGSPEKYTPFQIAYIYGLSSLSVRKTFDKLHIEKASPSDLHSIFENIEY